MTPPRRHTPLESVIERYLLEQCRAHGMLNLKFTSPARAGVPDRVVISTGGTVFVEVKRPGGKLDAIQVEMHAKMRRYGAQIYVVDDHEGVDQLISALTEKSTYIAA